MSEIVLGLVQGLTEFLPVSSSGHLVVFSKLFGLKADPSFIIWLHLFTLIAVIIFLRSIIYGLIKGLVRLKKEQIDLFIKLMIGTVPAVIAGFFIKPYLEDVFNSKYVVSIGLMLTAFLMLLSDRLVSNKKSLYQITWKDALIIGVFQAMAILPGISRSGSTIFGSLLVGVKREDSFTFSFLLSIPVILGAGIVESSGGNFKGGYIVPSIITLLSGLLALFLVRIFLRRKNFRIFGFYCALISILTFLFL